MDHRSKSVQGRSGKRASPPGHAARQPGATPAGRRAPGSFAHAAAETKAPSRSGVIWGVLLAAMTVVGGVMYPFASRGETAEIGRSIAPLASLSQPAAIERIFDPEHALASERWDAIVIHHSGSPVCTAATIDERHRAAGLSGLGYHFVIGNGRRTGDGEVHIGPRWSRQEPGAHVAGEAGLTLNHTAIGICLVGDGNRRPFTRAQIQRLNQIVGQLCERLDIPASRVFLHADVAHTTSPGRLFPESELRAYLASW